MRNIWSLRLFTFAAWLLAAACATYWMLQISARAAPNPLLARADTAGQSTRPLQAETLAVAHGLGAIGDAPVAAVALTAGSSGPNWNANRFALTGIMAQGSEKDGLIMLSVDGKPAQLLRLGDQVEPDIVVQALSRQSVTLANISQSEQPQLLTLTLGEKTPAQTGNAPAAGLNTEAAHAPPLAAALNGAFSNNAPAFPQASAAPGLQAPPFPPAPATSAVIPPAAAGDTATNTAASDEENTAQARENRRARRLTERAAANNPAAAQPAAPSRNADTPPPRRSPLADDNLYFGD